jgi:hypothetical protein
MAEHLPSKHAGPEFKPQYTQKRERKFLYEILNSHLEAK